MQGSMRPAAKRGKLCAPPGQALDPALVRCPGCGLYFPPESLAGHKARTPCGQSYTATPQHTASAPSRQQPQSLTQPPGDTIELPQDPASLEVDLAQPVESSRRIGLSSLALHLRRDRLQAQSKQPVEPEPHDHDVASSEVVAAVAEACTQLHRSTCDRLLRSIAPQLGLPWLSAQQFNAAMLEDGQVLFSPVGIGAVWPSLIGL